MEREKLNRDEAIAYIQKVDRDREKWTQYLYGVDWHSPALYDAVINLEYLGIEQACEMLGHIVKERCFEFGADCQAVMDDFALASRVKAVAHAPWGAPTRMKMIGVGIAIGIGVDIGFEPRLRPRSRPRPRRLVAVESIFGTALALHPKTEPMEVEVRSSNGQVSIKGRLTNLGQYREVERIAKAVQGVVMLNLSGLE